MNSASALALQFFQLGWDSLIVGLGTGLVAVRLRERIVLSFFFGFCDGAAGLIGAAFLHRPMHIPEQTYFLLASAVVLLVMRGHRWALWSAPLIFSVDNFFAMTPPDGAWLLGASSGVLAFAGMCASSLLAKVAASSAGSAFATRLQKPVRRDGDA
jgi:hypothetical protein